MLSLKPLEESDLAQVLAIEQRSHSHPWTLGNFTDSLRTGYEAQGLWTEQRLIAYYVAMAALDESHLLNISVSPEQRRQGAAAFLLEQWALSSIATGKRTLWLEVRVSNTPAIALYRKHGFFEVGMRKNYYELSRTAREDAVTMRREL